jgi:hypothetical protein
MLRVRSVTRRQLASLILPALLGGALVLPATAAAAGPLSSSACTAVGTDVTCNLWARSGSLTLPGAISTPIFGFSSASSGAVGVPGPVLIVTAGDHVTVHVTNQLTVRTSVQFDGQAMVPDLTGIAASTSKDYTFTAGPAGTYLYEAGLLPGTEYQVAKGLYGALIVRPDGAPMQANNDAATAFDDEAVVILGEVDTTLNSSLTPATFDLRGYAPRYFLINGQAYPETDPITTASGQRLLVRYLNAGLQHHSMGVLGLRQTVVAEDGSALANPRRMVAESIAPGEGIDALIDVPATTASNTTYLLYDASLGLNNTTGSGTNAGLGGMLVRIDAAGVGGGGDTVGPTASGVAITAGGDLSATISDAATGANSVAGGEYFVDTLGAPGSGTALSGTFPADPASATATINVAALGGGNHVAYVRGRDGLGNWGAAASVPFALDAVGPATSAMTVTPKVANGTVGVRLTATADDRTKGASNIAQAEFFSDVAGPDGSGTPMTLSTTLAPVSSLTLTLSAATVNGLSNGNHALLVHARDAAGNWGATSSLTLTVDRAGPSGSAGSASPNPSNGRIGVNSTNPALRVLATFDDLVPSTVRTAEIFFDVAGANGAGIPMAPFDGLFNTVHERGYVDVPLSTILHLANGNHTILVHAKDSAGNWGSFLSVALFIDKVGPSVSGIVLTPPAANSQTVAVTAAISDVATGNQVISRAELFIDAVGANGTGRALTRAAASPATTLSGSIPAATIAALSSGNHTVYIHGRDAAGNWGPRTSIVLKIDRTAPTFSGVGLSPASIAAGTPTVTLTVNGASDGATGSGVASGEFWIANSNVPNGSGTAFSGLTASVPTASLLPGVYTVRVRIRDVAGNWSTGGNGVRTATLTVTGPVPDTIFIDGFELQTLPGRWTGSSTGSTTRLDVTTSAALSGTRGLRAQGNNNNYVQYTFGNVPSPATPIYDAKFQFRPNSQTSTGQDIFVAATNAAFTTRDFSVRYRRNSGLAQVQIQVGATANLTWTTILGGSSTNTIEAVWQAVGSAGPDPGTLKLYVNGAIAQTLATTSTSSVGAVRLGVQSLGGNTNFEYFDGFASKRSAAPYGP